MDEDTLQRFGNQFEDCLYSLLRAVSDAGGAPIPVWSKFKNRPLKDFLILVAASNNIRFVYEKGRED